MREADVVITRTQVRQARALLAWTQVDLAKVAGVAATTIAGFERGHLTPAAAEAAAIGAALEASGIRFVPGGVVGPPQDKARQPTGTGQPLRWIGAEDLSRWGGTRDGQSGLPELIGRLVLATCGPASIRFPSDESVQHHGWDGFSEVSIGGPYVPEGAAVWELGAQRTGIERKADEDFRKRSADPGGIDASRATFVFVTPQRWPGKERWAGARRAEGQWRDVRVFDADVLVHWLEQCPGVAEWLARRIGRRPVGLRGLAAAWEEWSMATRPPLSAELMTADRDEQATALLRWLNGAPSVIAVQAEAAEEAVAFLHAAIAPLPEAYRRYWLSRTLVAQSDAIGRDLVGLGPKLVVVLNGGDPGLAATLAADGHHVYVAFGSAIGSPHDVLRLRRPWRHTLEAALLDMGLSHADAHARAASAGRSLTILRRLMPAGPAGLPKWAAPPVSRFLKAAMLAGSWNRDHPRDREMLERLSGRTYDEVEAELTPLATAFDGPMRRSGSIWKLASLRDAWFLLANQLTDGDMEATTDLFLEIMSEPDPDFEGGSNRRWHFRTGPPAGPSSAIRKGLGEAVIALGVYPERVSTVPEADRRADLAVRTLLQDADDRRWWSLSDDLRLLAEASPTAFLDCLDGALASEPSPVLALFRTDEGVVHPTQYVSDLLWALELLCWSADHFGRAVMALARLADMDPDPDGKMRNRPLESLKGIFLPWHPQTHASPDERILVLDMVLRRHPRIGWNLLLAIAPSHHGFATSSALPLWRDFTERRSSEKTDARASDAYIAIGDRLLRAAAHDAGRWVALLDHWASFNPDWRASAVETLRVAAESFDQDERIRFVDALRRFITKHEAFPDADWTLDSKDLDVLRRTMAELEPGDGLGQYAWRFGNPSLNYRRDLSWEEARQRDDMDRRDAANHVLRMAGTVEEVLGFAALVERPDTLGVAIARADVDRQRKEGLLDEALLSGRPGSERLAQGIASGLADADGQSWLRDRFVLAVSAGRDARQLLALAFVMPAIPATWDVVETAGDSVARAYWRQLSVFGVQSSEDVGRMATKLAEVGRGRAALECIAAKPELQVASALIISLLRDPTTIRPDPDGRDVSQGMFGYCLGQIFQRLDHDPTVGEADLVGLEWIYFGALQSTERPARTLHKALATDPAFFVTMVKAIYACDPEDGPADAGGSERTPDIAQQAYRVLEDWTWIPGSDGNGVIDAAALMDWVGQSRRLLAEAHRARIGDYRIGVILSASPRGANEPWPPEPVRDVIEACHSRRLEEGFEIGLYNRRGVTVRLPTDGGDQERRLAEIFWEDAKASALAWPRTRSLLERIGNRYRRSATHEDQSAEQRSW